jgi:outer membrane protein assembly factor BamB
VRLSVALVSVLAAAGAFVLPRPPFPPAAEGNGSGRLKLALVTSQPNRITDEQAWFRRNGLRVPAGAAAGSYVIRQGGTNLVISGSTLTAENASTGQPRYSFDFRRYAYAPVTAPGEREFVRQEIVWAAQAGGVLYIEHAHSTYARSSGFRNAYVTAIDLKTRKLRWRSPALVANARTFVLLGSVLVTGYGFTDEPDYLFLLDRGTGELVDRLPLPSGPEYVLRKGGRLYVRTYDHNVVAKLYRP